MDPEKESWKRLNIGVLRLLSELDPYSLSPGTDDGAPADEYDTEAKPMVSILQSTGAITADQIDAVWREWFGETLTAVVGYERIDELVARLILLSRQHH